LNPVLEVTIGDMQGDSVTWSIMSNSSGVWSVVGSGTLVDGNGSVSVGATGMVVYETVFWWSVNATDGIHWTNETFMFMTEAAPGVWWDAGWLYRRLITVDPDMMFDEGRDSSLDGFPLLVELVDDHLGVFAQSDGDDIVFTDHDGVVLPHEIESFDPGMGHLVAWVNVSTLWVDTPTSLYLYYGNDSCESQQDPMGVWDDE